MLHTEQSEALVRQTAAANEVKVCVGWADRAFSCGLLPAICVQDVWRGNCLPHESAQPRLTKEA